VFLDPRHLGRRRTLAERVEKDAERVFVRLRLALDLGRRQYSL
jgi:hypothetical protein